MDRYNANPVALSEGKVFVDGVQIADGVKFELKFTPKVWSGKVLGERSSSSRWLGYEITGTITRRVMTPWYNCSEISEGRYNSRMYDSRGYGRQRLGLLSTIRF